MLSRTTRKSKPKHIVIVLLLVLSIPLGILGYPYIRAVYMKTYGVWFSPDYVIPPANITFMLQDDTTWAKKKLGASQSTLGGSGCLLTCIAVSMNYLDSSNMCTPASVNDSLLVKDGLTKNGLVIWSKIQSTFSSFTYSYSNSVTSDDITSDLQHGLLPIVGVGQNGIAHWVLIIGSTNNDFVVMDPLNHDKTPTRLSTYGKVFAYRVIKKI